MTDQQAAVIRNLTSWRVRFFFLSKLPSLWFWRVRVTHLNLEEAKVRIPFSWRTKNPFRSVYFSAQAGAAELSTGVLALVAIGDPKSTSMLVTQMEASFSKKAATAVTFHCTDGALIRAAVAETHRTGEGVNQWVSTIGTDEQGNEVSRFRVHWSFKARRA